MSLAPLLIYDCIIFTERKKLRVVSFKCLPCISFTKIPIDLERNIWKIILIELKIEMKSFIKQNQYWKWVIKLPFNIFLGFLFFTQTCNCHPEYFCRKIRCDSLLQYCWTTFILFANSLMKSIRTSTLLYLFFVMNFPSFISILPEIIQFLKSFRFYFIRRTGFC